MKVELSDVEVTCSECGARLATRRRLWYIEVVPCVNGCQEKIISLLKCPRCQSQAVEMERSQWQVRVDGAMALRDLCRCRECGLLWMREDE